MRCFTGQLLLEGVREIRFLLGLGSSSRGPVAQTVPGRASAGQTSALSRVQQTGVPSVPRVFGSGESCGRGHREGQLQHARPQPGGFGGRPPPKVVEPVPRAAGLLRLRAGWAPRQWNPGLAPTVMR